MSPEVFVAHVHTALEEMPPEFTRKLDNVDVLVEELADPETLMSMGIPSPYQLLGLYVGVPITQQSVFAVIPVPDRIYLYRLPILCQRLPLRRHEFQFDRSAGPEVRCLQWRSAMRPVLRCQGRGFYRGE